MLYSSTAEGAGSWSCSRRPLAGFGRHVLLLGRDLLLVPCRQVILGHGMSSLLNLRRDANGIRGALPVPGPTAVHGLRCAYGGQAIAHTGLYVMMRRRGGSWPGSRRRSYHGAAA